jgi:hypothetical protein
MEAWIVSVLHPILHSNPPTFSSLGLTKHSSMPISSSPQLANPHTTPHQHDPTSAVLVNGQTRATMGSHTRCHAARGFRVPIGSRCDSWVRVFELGIPWALMFDAGPVGILSRRSSPHHVRDERRESRNQLWEDSRSLISGSAEVSAPNPPSWQGGYKRQPTILASFVPTKLLWYST